MNRLTFAHQVIRASAGSGKTFQLTSRCLALLFGGADPDTILATTFTRKAAGEILDRVLHRLAEAAADPQAADALAADLGLPKDASLDAVGRLRRLLDNLHRLRIGTLDSFHMSLAGSFSLELGLPAGWSIGEELDDRALRREALDRLLSGQPDDVVRLFPLLSKGESKRSVHEELDRVINDHYDLFRSSEPAAWHVVQAPAHLPESPRLDALIRLAEFDMSICGHKGFAAARDKAVADIQCEDWPAFVANGLAKKVRAEEATYQRKPIPPEVQALYTTLLQHAQAEILRKLAEQNQATYDLLQRFHVELWSLKQASGQLRFDEVTRALVEALDRKSLRADGLAFRLDGSIEHLLLDEFQDTSHAQWRVLEPIAQAITGAAPDIVRSFFCVGDVKQAIYGWRGGMAEIFAKLESSLGPLQHMPLDESRRSAPVVIEAVNRVFGSLDRFEAGDNAQAGINAWRDRFVRHTTHRTGLPGYVALISGPAKLKEQDRTEYRKQYFKHVAREIRAIHENAPGRSIGVLCRKKNTVGRMIYELRQLEVEASEEAGSSLDDSPAVEAILSLFTLADHPGHSIAWFHLKNSPFSEEVQEFDHPDRIARQVRSELLRIGYGELVHRWAKALAPVCDRRDLSRLQQLVEMAYDFQGRSTLRADDFVQWVRAQRVPDPSPSPVRVMTIHGAKGLEFETVVLPELDDALLGQTPAFVAGRDDSLAVDAVCRYVNDDIQDMLEPAVRRAFVQHRQHEVEESLSLLYVAMTRAVHALYMFIPGPGTPKRKDAWFTLLHQALAEGADKQECAPLFAAGTPAWHQASPAPARPTPGTAVEPPPRITFQADATTRRRGLECLAPSKKEGNARLPLKHLFKLSEGTGMAAGTLFHAWFETIAWLDDGDPTEAKLRDAALAKRWELPADTWRELDRLLAEFRTWLRNPAISGMLGRSAYGDTKHPAFPARLAPLFTRSLIPHRVECERRFLVRDDATFWNGSFDRIVWLADGDRTVAADVIDFKTDALQPGDHKALAERTEHYRPQLEAYRRAVCGLAGLPPECVAARLVFPFAGKVVEL